MKKPEYYSPEPVIDFFDIIRYVEEKYNIKTQDYANKFDKDSHHDDRPYLNYWHYLLNNIFDPSKISNGCTVDFPIYQLIIKESEYTDNTPDWVMEISQLIYNEFKEDEMNVYISW